MTLRFDDAITMFSFLFINFNILIKDLNFCLIR